MDCQSEEVFDAGLEVARKLVLVRGRVRMWVSGSVKLQYLNFECRTIKKEKPNYKKNSLIFCGPRSLGFAHGVGGFFVQLKVPSLVKQARLDVHLCM